MARYVTVSAVNARAIYAKEKPEGISLAEHVRRSLEKDVHPVLCEKPDLIVLPELCDRLLDLPPEENRAFQIAKGDFILNFMRQTAREHHCYLVYPTHLFLPDGTARNALYMIDRNGEILGTYHKNFLMITEKENYNARCGKEIPVFECDFGRVCPQICFDLNFEENRKRIKALKPDLTVFSSMYHGGLMQNFVAYDTRSYFVSAICRVCDCRSGILSPQGEPIAMTTNYMPYVTARINLDYALCHLDFNWEKLDAAREKYGSKMKVYDPGYLGSVLVTSETDEFTVDELLQEFGIEKLDDYMERSIRHREENCEA